MAEARVDKSAERVAVFTIAFTRIVVIGPAIGTLLFDWFDMAWTVGLILSTYTIVALVWFISIKRARARNAFDRGLTRE